MSIKNFLFKRGYLIFKTVKSYKIENFLKRFRENFVSVDLVRVGGNQDGGYLVPNLLNNINYCFSPGVDKNSDFESYLSNTYGIKSFMADASVSDTPIKNDNFTFIKKFIGSRSENDFTTLKEWMNDSVDMSEDNLILQMDIEGSEYEVLIVESEEILRRFSIMIIEFHNVQEIFEKNFFNIFSSIFEKIYRNFSICHVHPNNCCGIVTRDGIEVPKVIEITFIRNDFLNIVKNNDTINLPHKLDRKNVLSNSDINMPDKWWKK
jgi:hypothetical protein